MSGNAARRAHDVQQELKNVVIPLTGAKTTPIPLELETPILNIMTNTTRGGSEASRTVDIYGLSETGNNLRYACLKLRSGDSA